MRYWCVSYQIRATGKRRVRSVHERVAVVLRSIKAAAWWAVICISLVTHGHLQAAPKKSSAQHHNVGKRGLRDAVSYGQRDEVLRFGSELAKRNGLHEAWVLATLKAARFKPAVTKLIMPAPVATAKNWAAYRSRFIEPRRVLAGLGFWRANEAWLRKAEQIYGVPPEVSVGIIGVETLFGRIMGRFRVIDALATLGFDYPPGVKDRSAFFRAELEQLFVLCRAQNRDPLALTGSYAGAFGMPQFMPSSFNKYALDFNKDGRIDLHHSTGDVIGSVANAMANFGWQRSLPTRFDVKVPQDAAKRSLLLAPDVVPTFTAKEFGKHGAELSAAGQAYAAKLALVELHNGGAPASYVAGTQNFYAITRYNRSSYYALAVIELGEAIKALARQQPVDLSEQD